MIEFKETRVFLTAADGPLDADPRVPPTPHPCAASMKLWCLTPLRGPLCCQMPPAELQTVPPAYHGGLFTGTGTSVRPTLLWSGLCWCVSSNSHRKAAVRIHLNLLLSAIFRCAAATLLLFSLWAEELLRWNIFLQKDPFLALGT